MQLLLNFQQLYSTGEPWLLHSVQNDFPCWHNKVSQKPGDAFHEKHFFILTIAS